MLISDDWDELVEITRTPELPIAPAGMVMDPMTALELSFFRVMVVVPGPKEVTLYRQKGHDEDAPK